MKYDHLVPKNFSLELEFSTRVLHLKSLHYGLWEENQKLDVENLGIAQKRYTQKILDFIPKDVKKVLDVGAGIGDNAIALAKERYEVTSISPEIGQKEHFEKIIKENKGINFVHSKFEELSIDEKFDLILMSESSNYFPMEIGLKQVKRYLRKGGYLLIAGMFRKNDEDVYEEVHKYEEYVSKAKENGLSVIKDDDVTQQVIPTLELADKYYSYYVNPAIDVLSEFYQYKYSFKTKILKLLFSKEIKVLKDTLFELLPRRFDVERFREHVSYRFILFKMDSE